MEIASFSEQRQSYFPFEPIPNVTVKAVTLAEAYAVTGELTDKVFTPSADLGLLPFQPTPTLLKEQSRQHREQFVFYDGENRPIGWSIGEQRQGENFFMTWSGILPEWQRKGIYSTFYKQFRTYIKSLGYVRITSNHMVNNRSVLIAKLKAGFIITGFSLDERIGACVWMTDFLDSTQAEGFEKAFSLERYQ